MELLYKCLSGSIEILAVCVEEIDINKSGVARQDRGWARHPQIAGPESICGPLQKFHYVNSCNSRQIAGQHDGPPEDSVRPTIDDDTSHHTPPSHSPPPDRPLVRPVPNNR